MKRLEADEARRLRQEGCSLNEITQKLGVAKSSVSMWVRHIELTVAQRERLKQKGLYREVRYKVIFENYRLGKRHLCRL